MKKLLLAGFAVSALALLGSIPAEAQGGCGPYGHRGFDGFCHPGGGGFARPYGFYGRPYGYGWHRPFGYGYGWRRHW